MAAASKSSFSGYVAISGAVVAAAVVMGLVGSYQMKRASSVGEETSAAVSAAGELELAATDSFEATSSGSILHPTSSGASDEESTCDSFEATSSGVAMTSVSLAIA